MSKATNIIIIAEVLLLMGKGWNVEKRIHVMKTRARSTFKPSLVSVTIFLKLKKSTKRNLKKILTQWMDGEKLK